MAKVDKYRDDVLSHLEYIRDRVDQINGRVRANERQISWMKGIGSAFVFITGAMITWFKIGD